MVKFSDRDGKRGNDLANGELILWLLKRIQQEREKSLRRQVMVFFTTLVDSTDSLFRANNEFDIVSKERFITGGEHLTSSALLFSFGLLGLLGGQVLRLLVTTVYC